MSENAEPKREVLPIPDVTPIGLTTYDAKDPDTAFPPITPLRPPAGAPNVLIVLIDDAGFGSSSAFGGPCHTPTFERLAAQGLRYSRFHTTALCAPTRAALLTGRNHHFVHEGGFSHIAMSAGFPGYDGRIPSTAGTIAEILRDHGYSTFGVGKFGLTPDEEATELVEAQWLRKYAGNLGYIQLGFVYQGLVFLHETTTEWYERFQTLLEDIESFQDIVIDDNEHDEDE